jgi:hypothetical protein
MIEKEEYDKNKWNHQILRMDSSRLTQNLRITNRTDESMFDARQDGGRAVIDDENMNFR